MNKHYKFLRQDVKELKNTGLLILLLAFLFVSFRLELKWESVKTKNLPTNRHEDSALAIGEDYYVLAGRGMRPVNIYHPASNSWDSVGGAPLVINHFQAVNYKKDIMIMGAFTGNYPHETPIPNIWKFNIIDKKWSKGSEMPKDRLRGGAGCVVYKEKIYLVCGIQDGHYDGHVNWFDEYNPKTNTWKQLPNAPHARDHFAAVMVKDKLYVIGGRRSSAVTKEVFNLTIPEVDVFDFKSETWSTLSEDKNFPTPRAGCSAVAYHDKIYIIGGESPQPMAHNDVDVFDTKTQTWAKGPNLVEGRHGTGAGIIDGKIYIACGSATKGGGRELNNLEMLNLTQ